MFSARHRPVSHLAVPAAHHSGILACLQTVAGSVPPCEHILSWNQDGCRSLDLESCVHFTLAWHAKIGSTHHVSHTHVLVISMRRNSNPRSLRWNMEHPLARWNCAATLGRLAWTNIERAVARHFDPLDWTTAAFGPGSARACMDCAHSQRHSRPLGPGLEQQSADGLKPCGAGCWRSHGTRPFGDYRWFSVTHLGWHSSQCDGLIPMEWTCSCCVSLIVHCSTIHAPSFRRDMISSSDSFS